MHYVFACKLTEHKRCTEEYNSQISASPSQGVGQCNLVCVEGENIGNPL